MKAGRLALAVLVASVLPACEGMVGGWDLERMIEQPRYDPYNENDAFPDRRSMRPPVPGTVPRERVVGHAQLARGQEDGLEADTIPVPLTRELLERGRDRFDIYCGVCHGLTGSGNSVVAENMHLLRPPNLHQQQLREMTPGRLYRVVAEGYGLMPGYSLQLGVEDRWAVVAYVRALQLSQNVPIVAVPPDVRQRLEQE